MSLQCIASTNETPDKHRRRSRGKRSVHLTTNIYKSEESWLDEDDAIEDFRMIRSCGRDHDLSSAPRRFIGERRQNTRKRLEAKSQRLELTVIGGTIYIPPSTSKCLDVLSTLLSALFWTSSSPPSSRSAPRPPKNMVLDPAADRDTTRPSSPESHDTKDTRIELGEQSIASPNLTKHAPRERRRYTTCARRRRRRVCYPRGSEGQ